MFRRTIAGIILGPALLIGSFAWWGFLSLRTVFDEDRTETIAVELLDNEAVVDQIGANIGRALQAAMPDSIELSEEQVDAGVAIILTDPLVRDMIIDSLGTTHRAFLGLDDAPATIDLGPALVSARARIGAVAPSVAEQLPETFVVELPTERIPDASPVKDFLERTVPLLAGIAVTLALLAFLTTSDRSLVLGKAARWAFGTTAFYLIVGIGVPYLIRQFAPDGVEVVAALLTAVLRVALVPSIVLAVVGAVLLLLSMFWPDPGRQRNRDRSKPKPVPAVAVASAPTPQPVARPLPAAPVPAPAPAPAPRPPPTTPAGDEPTMARPATLATSLPAAPMPAPPMPAPPAAAPRPIPPPTTASRPLLPTRAKPPESVGLPAWTGEAATDASDPADTPSEPDKPRWLPPTWIEEHGWVMDSDDPRDPPDNARHVEGVGWVVPGPPPA